MAKECATFLEEGYDYETAIGFYTKASQLYEMDNQVTQGQQMNLKGNELKILCKQYQELPKIIKNYEKIAKKYLATPILKSSAKDLLFLSCLCYMANEDPIGAKKQMQMYCFEDPTFEGSRE